ncbi:MAG: hypothetical protein ACLQGP_35010 [Isosphaeraceae bacterium]
MNRILGLLASASLLLVIGCSHDYDVRLGKTIENLRYQKQLDDNLETPPDTKSSLATSNIYIRSPLGLKGPTKEIGLAPVEAGKFDVATSFIGDSASLHVLARVDKPKAATPKKGPNPNPAPASVRGDFTADVLDYLKGAYGVDMETAKLKADAKKSNNFKSTTLDLTAKEVQIYILGEKNSPAQVALIFDYPKEARNSLTSKIKYCLESFRVGPSAQRLYAGQDEEGEGGPATPTGVF